jgi:ABC-2 type transport system permease protein
VRTGGLSWGRLRELVKKEFRQTLRDPRAQRVIFLAPIIQLIVFGYAVNTDIRNTATYVLDRDRTADSRELVQALTASGYFRIVGYGQRPADLVEALDHGSAVLGIEIPRGFQADLAAGRMARVQVLIDGTTSNTATVAQGYVGQIVLKFGQQHSTTVAQTAKGEVPGVDLRVRAWYNPNLESRVYNVPGVVGMLMMLMSLLLTSLAVVRERELGTLEQLMVSPLKPAELILGKTLPVAGIALVDLVLITTMAILWFHIPMRGSFLLLFVASLLYIVCGLGIGLLISTVSSTTQEAFMTMFFFLLPAIILSGFMYPVDNMPAFFQYVTLLNPIRHYVEIVRAIFLKGAGLSVLWPQMTTLAVMGATILWFATTRFQKTSS